MRRAEPYDVISRIQLSSGHFQLMVGLAITCVQTLLILTCTKTLPAILGKIQTNLATERLLCCLGLHDPNSKSLKVTYKTLFFCTQGQFDGFKKTQASSLTHTPTVLQSLVISISGNESWRLGSPFGEVGWPLDERGSIHASVSVTCPFLVCVCVYV